MPPLAPEKQGPAPSERSPNPTGRSTARVVFAGALGLGIAIRAVEFVNCRSLSLDEARLAVNIAARSFLRLLAPLDMDQSAPPLFLWGERAAVQLLGHNACALRLLPVAAGTAAAVLMYPFARRYLQEAEARLAGMIGILCPLLITYSNAVKQYSTELLAAVGLLLIFGRTLAGDVDRRWSRRTLVAGVVAPWLSLTSVFVLSACWISLVAQTLHRRSGAARLTLAATVLWGVSGALAYLSAYRAARLNPYMHRFWELAFLSPMRPGFPSHLWKTVEDLVWGFVAGDPLVDRRPFLVVLHAGTAIVLIACGLGTMRILRTRGPQALWWLWGPTVVMVGASMVGAFPLAPRLTLFLLPAWIVVFVAGLSESLAWLGHGSGTRRLAVASIVLVLPLGFQEVTRTFALEPSGHFQQLVRELQDRRQPDEAVYVFARSLPAWIYYSTDWSDPDTVRLAFLTGAAAAGGPGFENARSRGRVRMEDAQGLTLSTGQSVELLGLPSGMEWREVEEHVSLRPDSGWVEVEADRIVRAARPGVWVLASTYYAGETDLFRRLERKANRRTYAHLRNGSALVRYEFTPGAVSPAD